MNPAKPTALKVIEGNRGKRKLEPEKEPQPKLGLPQPPRWLSKLAKQEWRKRGKQLLELGLMTELDEANFAAYCQAYADLQEAQAIIDKEGAIWVSKKSGYAQAHPAVAMKHKAMADLRKFSAPFGMTPSDRAGLHVEKPKQRLEDLLK